MQQCWLIQQEPAHEQLIASFRGGSSCNLSLQRFHTCLKGSAHRGISGFTVMLLLLLLLLLSDRLLLLLLLLLSDRLLLLLLLLLPLLLLLLCRKRQGRGVVSGHQMLLDIAAARALAAPERHQSCSVWCSLRLHSSALTVCIRGNGSLQRSEDVCKCLLWLWIVMLTTARLPLPPPLLLLLLLLMMMMMKVMSMMLRVGIQHRVLAVLLLQSEIRVLLPPPCMWWCPNLSRMPTAKLSPKAKLCLCHCALKRVLCVVEIRKRGEPDMLQIWIVSMPVLPNTVAIVVAVAVAVAVAVVVVATGNLAERAVVAVVLVVGKMWHVVGCYRHVTHDACLCHDLFNVCEGSSRCGAVVLPVHVINGALITTSTTSTTTPATTVHASCAVGVQHMHAPPSAA